MKKELHYEYRKICKYKGYKAGKEKVTNTLAMVGKVKGNCGKCGNWGHNLAQCPQKNNSAK